jgi:hypothetical protein
MSTALHTARRYFRSLGVRGLSAAVKGKIAHKPARFTTTRPELQAPLVLRVPSTDFSTFQ